MTDVFDDVCAPVVGKININIRWINAFGIQETFEQQAVTNRVHVRYFQKVSDERTGGATARDAGNSHAATVADEITDDEKVGDETSLFDDFHFDLQAVDHRFDGGGYQRMLEREIIFRAGHKRRQALRIIHARDDKFISHRLRVNRVAREKSFREPLPQKAFAREMFRRMKHRVMQILRGFRKFDFQIAHVGHGARVQNRLRHFGKTRLHLVRAAQIKLFPHIARAHALRIAQHGLRADADETIVRVRMTFLDVVNVVRRDEFQPKFLGELKQLFVHLRLFGNAVIL